MKVNKKEGEEEGETVFLKNLSVIKDKERLWKYPRLKESRDLTTKLRA